MEIEAGLVLRQGTEVEVTKLILDEPLDNEVLVKMVSAGICRTDIDVMEQYIETPLPAVLGHEGAGVVVKVGKDVTKVKEGDHVVLSLSSCGQCEKCKSGLPSYCIKHVALNFGGSRVDGSVCLHCSDGNAVHSHFFGQSSHSSYSVVNETSVIKVSKNADLRYLAPFACGIMTGAGGILNTLKPEAGSSIVIYGMGAVGLSAVMAAKIAGCSTVIAVDISENRLHLALEMGATHTFNGNDKALQEQISAVTNGGADYAFESSGVKKVMNSALDTIKENGTMILTGVLPQGETVAFDAWNLVRGRTIKGSIMGDCVPEIFIPKLISFYEEGRFPVDKMMKFFSLKDFNAAIKESLSGETIKAVITF
ncbi:NAD(P)-dependent alcohol dehydrogenase [Chryseobacterium daecheongense]|nr:NAD(P)-dependent alcohol dehydrogenase [Chryseobacterium daecheongense]